MNKFIEVMIVVGVLFLLAFVVGCKEEPVTGRELVHEQDFEIVSIETSVVLFEPNEPEFRILTISERINQAIPTWPDYIELEKDLVFGANNYVFPFASYDGYHVSTGATNTLVIPKGTKIYFKE